MNLVERCRSFIDTENILSKQEDNLYQGRDIRGQITNKFYTLHMSEGKTTFFTEDIYKRSLLFDEIHTIFFNFTTRFILCKKKQN